jgi:hypothetical protein
MHYESNYLLITNAEVVRLIGLVDFESHLTARQWYFGKAVHFFIKITISLFLIALIIVIYLRIDKLIIGSHLLASKKS